MSNTSGWFSRPTETARAVRDVARSRAGSVPGPPPGGGDVAPHGGEAGRASPPKEKLRECFGILPFTCLVNSSMYSFRI